MVFIRPQAIPALIFRISKLVAQGSQVGLYQGLEISRHCTHPNPRDQDAVPVLVKAADQLGTHDQPRELPMWPMQSLQTQSAVWKLCTNARTLPSSTRP
ncbi:hypothetical protein D3C85_1559440 [compost metagenome]